MYRDDDVERLAQTHDMYFENRLRGAREATEYMGYIASASFHLSLNNARRLKEVISMLSEIKSDLAALKKQGS